MTADDTVIDVRDLWMRYGAHDVLRGVDLRARRGEVLALVGPNGAGKTTVLGAWAVLVAPSVLRRMARRESGSLMEARRTRAMRRIG
ncbi:ATP-binding cassette domain-containing protein [Allokutzneria oryzae]|uniref:ATP-binding cassette domain-containing protein n=1 Tax=Allokutzneria oryzae TaxID=1378989 RepID=A0ABV6A0V5_9PSEU